MTEHAFWLRALFQVDMEWWRNTCAALWYSPSGSGYHLTYGCLLEMPYADIQWHAEKVAELRMKEAQSIRSSST